MTSTASGIITLLTDFGLDDPFVGVMKGVILSRHPQATLVDLGHGIAPGRVQEAAFWIERSYRYFADGTIHVVVVDPGVGSTRKPLAVLADGHFFIGPDNGVFGGVVARAEAAEARIIDLGRTGLAAPSRTFHGRDVFAPVAAELSAGRLEFESLGETTALGVASLRVEPVISEQTILGAVVTADRFGNLLTNIDAELLLAADTWDAEISGETCELVGTYSDVSSGSYLALLNAFGVVEIALRDGNASEGLGAGPGSAIVLRRRAT